MKKRIISLILAVSMLLSTVSMITSCDTKTDQSQASTASSSGSSAADSSTADVSGDNSSAQQADDEGIYMAYILQEYNKDGKYSGKIDIDANENTEFGEIKSDDFALVVNVPATSDKPTSYEINDFTVSQSGAKTLSYEFTTPFADDLEYTYLLLSKAAVTKDGHRAGCYISVAKPETEINCTAKGAYTGSDTVTIGLEIVKNGQFVERLTSDMFAFPVGLDPRLTVQRESDTKVTIIAKGLPENLSVEHIVMTVSDDAIVSEFPSDISLSIPYYHLYAAISPENITLDKENNTLTITDITLPEGVSAIQDGLAVFDGDVTESDISDIKAQITSQSCDTDKNSYNVSISLSDTNKETLENLCLVIPCKLPDDNMAHYAVFPCYAKSGFSASFENDGDNNKFTVTLTAENGKFTSDISLSDITVGEAEGLNAPELVSADENTVVLSFGYESEDNYSAFVSISMPGDKLTGYSDETVDTVLGLFAYSDDRDPELDLDDDDEDESESEGGGIDWADMGFNLALGADAFGKTLCGEVAKKLVLPYIYKYFGIAGSKTDSSKIVAQMADLSRTINEISHKIDNISSEIEDASQKLFFSSTYAKLENELLNTLDRLTSDMSVVNFISAGAEDEVIKGMKDYAVFMTMIGRKPDGTLTGIYNSAIDKAKKNTFINWVVQPEAYNGWADILYKNNPDLNIIDLDYFLRNEASPFKGDVAISMDVINAFTKAVEDRTYLANDQTWLNNITLLGNYILNSSAASAIDIPLVEKYFSCADMRYNFESQTYEAKKAFITRVQYIYYTNAAYYIQYCELKGDMNVSLETVKAQVKQVAELMSTYQTQLEDIETRIAAGNDKLLINGQLIKKELTNIKVSDRYDVDEFCRIKIYESASPDIANITQNGMEGLVKRAEKRGVTLIQDLTNAGFTGINPESGSTYKFTTTKPKYSEKRYDSGWEDTKATVALIFGASAHAYTAYLKCDMAVLEGSSYDKKYGELLATCDEYNYLSSASKYEYSYKHKLLLAFRPA